jgi:hypothetical protein
MTKIMTIFDIHTIFHRGIAIGGVNPSLDSQSPEDIKKIIGQSIEIHTAKASLPVKVLDVGITSSLTGKKNIFILLPLAFNVNDIDKYSIAYSRS